MTGGASVLVVDDDPSLSASTRLILAHKGYEVVVAQSGEDALSQSRRRAFDVILMDIRMRGLSGVETLLELRRQGLGTSVILMTAYAIDEVVDRALAAGAVEVLRKPVDVDQLIQLLQRLIAERGEV